MHLFVVTPSKALCPMLRRTLRLLPYRRPILRTAPALRSARSLSSAVSKRSRERESCTMREVSAAETVERLEELLPALKLGSAPLGRPLRIVGVGAGAWGSVFVAMLQVRLERRRRKKESG